MMKIKAPPSSRKQVASLKFVFVPRSKNMVSKLPTLFIKKDYYAYGKQQLKYACMRKCAHHYSLKIKIVYVIHTKQR